MDLLRRAPEGSADPLAMASFPLVPYANRIAHGRFTLDGTTHRLPLNFGDHPHSIHGLGWQQPWMVEAQTADSARLVHRHDGSGGWPWAYRAIQDVALTPAALTLTLTVENAGDASMPVGLGFHPYFLADEAATLSFDAECLWLSTPDMLPDRAVRADALGDWSRPAIVPGDRLIDNVYGGWSGAARVVRGDGIRLTLRARGAEWLHVYRPPRSADFCLEPVTHMPDTINRPDGMETLVPGESRSLIMTIAIDK